MHYKSNKLKLTTGKGTYRWGEFVIKRLKLSWRNIGLRKISIRATLDWGW